MLFVMCVCVCVKQQALLVMLCVKLEGLDVLCISLSIDIDVCI